METQGPLKGIYRMYIGVLLGLMEKKMETTMMGLCRDYIGFRV